LDDQTKNPLFRYEEKLTPPPAIVPHLNKEDKRLERTNGFFIEI